MGLLDKLWGKKVKENVDAKNGQIISDAQAVLRICKDCQHYGSISLHEMAYHFTRYQTGGSRERLENALKFLVENGFVHWNGQMQAEAQIGFTKSRLPTEIPKGLIR